MTGSGNILKQISKTAKQSEQVINCISHSKCSSGLDSCSLLLILQKNSYAMTFLMLFLLLLGAEFFRALDFKQWCLQPDSMVWPIRNSSRTHSTETICGDKPRYSYQPWAAISARDRYQLLCKPVETKSQADWLFVAVFQTCMSFCFYLLRCRLLSCLPLIILFILLGTNILPIIL